MDYQKIHLSEKGSLSQVFSAIQNTQAKKIILIATEDVSFLTRIDFLKKIKFFEAEENKEFLFVIRRKFFRDILKKYKLKTAASVPSEYLDPETETAVTPEATKKETAAFPEFSQKRIVSVSNKTKKTPTRAKLFFGVLGTCILGVSIFWGLSSKAIMKIVPNVKPVSNIQNFIISLPDAKIPEQEQALPKITAEILETTLTEKKVIPTSGRLYKVSNAKGKITIFNDSKSPKFFIPSRLKAKNGAIFRFKKNITVPASANGTPGKLTVEVEADENTEEGLPIGEKGNIENDAPLIFPSLRPESQGIYYALADQGPLVGGSTLVEYFVSPNEAEKAKENFQSQVSDKALQQLKGMTEQLSREKNETFVLFPNEKKANSEVLSFDFPEELQGKKLQTVEVSGTLKQKQVVFNQTAITENLRQKIKKSLDSRYRLLQIDKKTIEYDVINDEFLWEDGWAKISVKISGVQVVDIDPNNDEYKKWSFDLKKQLVNKTITDARGIILNTPEISSINAIQILPPWKKTFPSNPEKIAFDAQQSQQ